MFLDRAIAAGRACCATSTTRQYINNKAIAAVKELFAAARGYLLEAHRAVAVPDVAPAHAPPNANAAVDPLQHLRDMGVPLQEEPVRAAAPRELELRTVDEEFNAVAFKLATVALPRDHLKFNPMSVFADGAFPIARRVALDVLSVPGGEAPSERIFSIAGRVITPGRARLSAESLANATYVMKNRKALNMN